MVALVGPSGAGKTTLADLLPRFHDPTGGRILMDGVPLTRLTRRSLRALMGVVSQDTVLLNDTVHANIAYGSPGATREQVEAAARGGQRRPVHRASSRRATTRSWASGAPGCRAASASGSPSPGRCCATRRS